MTDATRIRALVIDDERLARNFLLEMLREDEEVEVIGECLNGLEAIEAIRTHAPDLIFLDVQMPELGGFDVLEAIASEKMPFVIFVTAYDQHAVRAFEVNALDFLLKPFDRKRFRVAWQKAKTRIQRERNELLDQRILSLLQDLKAEPNYLERLVLKTNGRIFFLETEEVDWIGADGNYVSVHSGEKSYLLRDTISSLDAQLDPKKFLRIHRSAIVKIDRIRELQPLFHGDYRVIMRNGTELTLSRNYREKLQEALGKAL
ncbi:MAG: two-component system, LytTR family, response regulator [Blastocatellia bacterium]|jgi:two-component system LytT family response regulator|nr:two-component system, LytTR family, response regulator [Blastocatellia bacterium]